MYRSLLELSVFSLLINASFFTQTLTSDIQADGLKGRVKTVRYQTARLSRKSDEWIEDKLKPQKLISYDENGNRVEELIHTYIDDIMDGYTQAGTRVNYRYDGKGNRTENVLIDRGYEKEAVIYRRVFRHDQSGKRQQEFLYGRNTRLSGSISTLGAYTHEYDTKGRRTATTGVISGRVNEAPRSKLRGIERIRKAKEAQQAARNCLTLLGLTDGNMFSMRRATPGR